jgi:hypothetical protein
MVVPIQRYLLHTLLRVLPFWDQLCLVLHYLGQLPKVIHPLALLFTEAGDPLPLKEGAPTHLVPIKGQVHNTTWLELTLPHHYRCHIWPLSTYQNLTKLTNDPILHDATWPAMPTKLPSDIPKFE